VIRYLLSKLLEPILGCDTSALRSLNSGAICLICPLVYRLLRLLRARSNVARKQDEGKETIEDIGDPSMILDAHSALNITLFPPLFFFSTLYYTDVISTLLVLMSYDTLLRHRGSALDRVKTVVIGLAALSFRQTNIFWVAIYPAGITLVNELKRVEAPPTNPGTKDVSSVLKSSWDHGTIYDCSIEEATPQGMFCQCYLRTRL
jgi:alpha-1,2-glucosyltransferase